MTELEMLRLACEGHVRLIADLAQARDNLIRQRDRLKEINALMITDRERLIAERDALREECDELLWKIPNY